MKKKWLELTGIVVSFLFLASVEAAPSPLPMMQQIAQNMITELKNNKDRLAGNAPLVRRIVNQILIPHVDIYAMAGKVVGRNDWLKASHSDREVFADLFKNRIISTYASALSSYDGDRVLFYPMRQGVGSYANVRSMIVRRSGQEISVSYNLRYQNGDWKIIDLSVENVSIVDNYRAQYATTLNQGGLGYLITKMGR
jgi:phospholipid transport system substrate-binding protein